MFGFTELLVPVIFIVFIKFGKIMATVSSNIFC